MDPSQFPVQRRFDPQQPLLKPFIDNATSPAHIIVRASQTAAQLAHVT
jgi:hypothetical protein